MDRFSVRVEIFEIGAFWFSRVAGLVIAHVAQTGAFRHFDRVSDDLDLRDSLFFLADLGSGCRHVSNTCAVQWKAAIDSKRA